MVMTQTIRQDAPGQMVRTQPATEVRRMTVFVHAVMFVLGFTVVFTLLGSAAGLLGRSLNVYLPVVQKLGAMLLVIFALVTMGVFGYLSRLISGRVNLSSNPAAAALVSVLDWFSMLLYTERRVADMHRVNHRLGLVSSFLLGVSFSAGWVPCVGPILASIFFLASDAATAWQGALLLFIYSMGLGVPFLITGLAFSRMTGFLRKLNRHAGIVSIISGIFLLYVAYLLWFDRLAILTTQFIVLNEWVFALEDWVGVASGTGGDLIDLSVLSAAPLAFIAGLISFISPCVLPLVPAYIGFLTGAAVGGAKAKTG
jgi:cytochrome c-type biogenesis protein